ncbi:GNAT family [Fusarium albosuccineum]|uniref:GNAT family n=1 Tax=Fusarium albosuccineum TaxID=1237068 RepID=A0A8H4LGG6_9HYPO|nr:GNAT family [Fusarium albosuccineum]
MITDGLSTAFQSERLVYRAVENNEADKRFLLTEIVNNPVNTALSDPSLILPKGEKDAEKLVEGLHKATLAVMVCLPNENEPDCPTPIGFVILGWGRGIPAHAHHRTTTIGISLATPFQGKGYGGEIIHWALDWAFRFGGYHRVAIGTVAYNERAQHLYKKLGFIEEGRNREAHLHDRKWYDTINYGMLESEWEALRGLQN